MASLANDSFGFSTALEGFSKASRGTLFTTSAATLGSAVVLVCSSANPVGTRVASKAVMFFMLYFANGAFKTSHYAICTGISYLGLMLPGMVSGWLKDSLGYRHFFVLVMAFCIITFVVTAFVKIDPHFGKKTETEE
jgi:PAT family beta-lactamase induction signal transducer AmpG